jgi:hypothetical protein
MARFARKRRVAPYGRSGFDSGSFQSYSREKQNLRSSFAEQLTQVLLLSVAGLLETVSIPDFVPSNGGLTRPPPLAVVWSTCDRSLHINLKTPINYGNTDLSVLRDRNQQLFDPDAFEG